MAETTKPKETLSWGSASRARPDVLKRKFPTLADLRLVARRRVLMPFGLVYQTSPQDCAAVPEIVRAIVEQDNRAKLVRCGFLAFGASSLDFELIFDVPSAENNEVAAARHARSTYG